MERMFDIFQLTEFARPLAAGQLPGRVFRHVTVVRKEGDLFEFRFRLFARTYNIAQSGKRGTESLESDFARRPLRPKGLAGANWPPPIRGHASGPGDAVVEVIGLAAHVPVGALEAGKNQIDSFYHR